MNLVRNFPIADLTGVVTPLVRPENMCRSALGGSLV